MTRELICSVRLVHARPITLHPTPLVDSTIRDCFLLQVCFMFLDSSLSCHISVPLPDPLISYDRLGKW